MSSTTIYYIAFIPTLSLWTSTESWQASKRIIVKILPCLRRFQSWSRIDSVSKRERNLTLAKESLQWRKQQVSHVNNLPPANRLQGVESAIDNLRSRQLESHNSGTSRRSPVPSFNHQSPEPSLPSKVIRVKSAVENNHQSEVLLKCASLKLMDNLNDPVRKISSFRACDP